MRKYKVFTITIILVIILESILVQDSVFCETEDTLRVNLNNYIRTDGCRASNKNIEFFEDSTISYSVFIPFYSDSIRIHANSDSKLGVKINDMESFDLFDKTGWISIREVDEMVEKEKQQQKAEGRAEEKD